MTSKSAILVVLQMMICAVVFAGDLAVSRGAHRNTTLALIDYQEVSNPHLESRNDKLKKMLKSFVLEGGYIPKELVGILKISTASTEKVARIVRQLDGKPAVRAGTPGPLCIATAVALAYSKKPTDGLRASASLGEAVSDDPQARAMAKAAYVLISECMTNSRNRESVLYAAAKACGDEKVASAIRSVRLSQWRKIVEGAAPLSDFKRSLYIWYYAKDSKSAMVKGKKHLNSVETRQFLAAFSAGWYGSAQNNLDSPNNEIAKDLYDTAEEGILVSVGGNEIALLAKASAKKEVQEPEAIKIPKKPERPPVPERPVPIGRGLGRSEPMKPEKPEPIKPWAE